MVKEIILNTVYNVHFLQLVGLTLICGLTYGAIKLFSSLKKLRQSPEKKSKIDWDFFLGI